MYYILSTANFLYFPERFEKFDCYFINIFVPKTIHRRKQATMADVYSLMKDLAFVAGKMDEILRQREANDLITEALSGARAPAPVPVPVPSLKDVDQMPTKALSGDRAPVPSLKRKREDVDEMPTRTVLKETSSIKMVDPAKGLVVLCGQTIDDVRDFERIIVDKLQTSPSISFEEAYRIMPRILLYKKIVGCEADATKLIHDVMWTKIKVSYRHRILTRFVSAPRRPLCCAYKSCCYGTKCNRAHYILE